MSSMSPLFSIPTYKSPAAITAATLTFSITSELPIPKTQKKPAPRRTSPKPTKLIPPTPILSPTSPSPPAIPIKKVLVPIGFGTEEMEAVIITDVLRRAGAAVTVASVEEQLEVEASGGIKLVADAFVSACSDEIFDLVALPGGMPGSARLRDSKILQQITRTQAEGKRLYGAICAAPAVTLLPWGLIKRKKTTCHPAFTDKLPTFWAVKTNLQVSEELTTSRGPGTSFEFAVSFVEQLFGLSAAKEICDSMLINLADENSRKDDNPRREEFNKASWSLDRTPQVIIPVSNGSEEIEVVTIVDILRRAKADVTVASVEKSLQIMASGGLKIVADMTIGAAAESIYDLIILPGGKLADKRLSKSKILQKMLKSQKSAGRIVGAIGSSPAILQGVGLLKEKRFTAHPSVISTVDGGALNSAQVVIDDKLITGKGLGTAMHFTLSIVGKLFGQARARSVAEGLVFEYPW